MALCEWWRDWGIRPAAFFGWKTSEISSCSSSILAQRARLVSMDSMTGLTLGKAVLKLLKRGSTTTLKNPHWLLVIPALSRSMRGDFCTAPISASRSPCAKNSCSSFCTHRRCTFDSQYACPMSAHLSATWKQSEMSSGRSASKPSAPGSGGGTTVPPPVWWFSLSWCAWTFFSIRRKRPRRLKWSFMSVARTMSMMALRISVKTSTLVLEKMSKGFVSITSKAAAMWWFSSGLRSLYFSAVSSWKRIKKSLFTPLCS
mmetsp:Transcript_8817/g.22584  ORF Transcript_8817/g.22584 Transcript_8817/m.22584 type:complete len:258 (+) Transcript_8817:287-1060(+)